MKKAESKRISRTESGSMVGSRGRDKKIIGKAPRQSTQGPHPTGRWVKKIRDQHHAEGASLGNATGVVISITKHPSNVVVIFAAGVKAFIGKKGSRREPPNAAYLDEKLPLQLVETFENVGRAPCGMLASKFGIFKMYAIHVPRIFSPYCLRGPSKHGLIFPRGNPALESLKGSDPPEPVAHRQDG